MLRSIIISVLLALAAGCAATPATLRVVAAPSGGRATSEELDCMSECLRSADETCETCAHQCLDPASEPAASVALIH